MIQLRQAMNWEPGALTRRRRAHCREARRGTAVALFTRVESNGKSGTPAGGIDERVLVLLRERGPLDALEIGQALGIDRAVARASLERLRKRGRASVMGKRKMAGRWGEGGHVAVWRVDGAP